MGCDPLTGSEQLRHCASSGAIRDVTSLRVRYPTGTAAMRQRVDRVGRTYGQLGRGARVSEPPVSSVVTR
jgi:hypothetical protein